MNHSQRSWEGVTEIRNKVADATYRANAVFIVAVLAVLALSFFGWVFDGTWFLKNPNAVIIISITFIFLWVVSFTLGYLGVVGRGVYQFAHPVSRNTDLTFERKVGVNLQHELEMGILSTTEAGITGVVYVPWANLLSVAQQGPNKIQLTMADVNFHIKFGKRFATLYFVNPTDATEFITVVQDSIKNFHA